MFRIGCPRALLLRTRSDNSAPAYIQLVPANLRDVRRASASNRLCEPQRLDPVEILILLLHHHPIRKRVQAIAIFLRHVTWTSTKRSDGHVGGTRETRIGRHS